MTNELASAEVVGEDIPIDNDSIMRAIIGGQSPDPERNDPRRKPRELQYWRVFTCGPECSRHRNRKGWVSTGPVLNPLTAIEYTDFMEVKHAVPLSKQYGVDAGRLGSVPGSGTMYDGPTRFQLLLANGGLKEIPDDQLIAYGWHRIPEVRVVRPHLAFMVKDIACEYGCPLRLFTSEEAYSSHVKAMHEDSAGARAVGRQIEQVLVRTASTSQLDPNALAAAITQAVLTFESNKANGLIPASGNIGVPPVSVDDLDEESSPSSADTLDEEE